MFRSPISVSNFVRDQLSLVTDSKKQRKRVQGVGCIKLVSVTRTCHNQVVNFQNYRLKEISLHHQNAKYNCAILKFKRICSRETRTLSNHNLAPSK